MAFRSPKTLQMLQRRTFHQWTRCNRIVSPIPYPQSGMRPNIKAVEISRRCFGKESSHHNGKWFEDWVRNGHHYHRHGFGKPRFGRYYRGMHHSGKDFFRMCRRHHGHHGHFGAWKGGFWGGVSFGACLSIVISYHNHQSIVWAAIHGFLSWIYVIYYALSEYNSQEKGANELISVQMSEISNEIERLNQLYSNATKQMNDARNKGKEDGTVAMSMAASEAMSEDPSLDKNEEMLRNLAQKVDRLQNEIDRQNESR